MIYHLTAFVIGFVLDRIIGDPMDFPHPIRLIGRLISFFDKKLLGDVSGEAAPNRDPGKERAKGFLMVALMLFLTGAVVSTLMVVTYRIHPYAGVALEAVLTCYCLAAKSLKVESMKVAKALKEGTLEDGKKAVSMIVGRDTVNLDEKGVIRAAVETVAENTSDGVIAPLLCTFIGGSVLGLLYKTVNTMDSMVGYHNDRYENFG
ncbi:MAG: cobalamin biosynthesis protein, partial [Lachnospiraceae bacterium]|nr:cobalamin biosynthesis protein [Lachnospiraceae bacterium]